MELVALVQLLWTRRVLVALGFVLALAAGFGAGKFASQRHVPATGGVAWAKVVVDTARSQLVAGDPKASETSPMRASLLADVTAGDSGRSIIAGAAGVQRDQLTVHGPAALMLPSVETPLTTEVTAVSAAANTPYVLNFHADGLSPLIAIEAQAPDSRGAVTLAEAAVRGLRSLLVAHDPSASRGFVVETVAPPLADEPASGSRAALLAAAAAVATFGLWCGCIVVVAGMTRRRRLA